MNPFVVMLTLLTIFSTLERRMKCLPIPFCPSAFISFLFQSPFVLRHLQKFEMEYLICTKKSKNYDLDIIVAKDQSSRGNHYVYLSGIYVGFSAAILICSSLFCFECEEFDL